MKLWKRAAGALKDQNSVMVATLSRRTPFRIPELEAAIVKATSHDETRIDYKNTDTVFKWVRTSPVSLKPLIFALTARMERTSSWAVALKGLLLIHGIFCCKTPAVQRIGRLPFDLSDFEDGHTNPSKMWGYNSFVRAYFTFLDNRGALLYTQCKQTVEPSLQELARLQDWQALLDMLLLIKPMADNMRQELILEAMDCVVIEIFDLYHRICNALPKVLVKLCNNMSDDGSAEKVEASVAMKVVLKAKKQAEDLDLYFRFCKVFGVQNAKDVPEHLPQIREDDIRELQRMINDPNPREEDKHIDEKALLIVSDGCQEDIDGLKTIITDKWEVFDDECCTKVNKILGCPGKDLMMVSSVQYYNPFEIHPSSYDHDLLLVPAAAPTPDLPDLITF